MTERHWKIATWVYVAAWALCALGVVWSTGFYVELNDFWGNLFAAEQLDLRQPASLHNGFYPIGYLLLLRVLALGDPVVGAGLANVALGVLLTVSPGIPYLGRLPGDIRIERPGLRLYLPITTCLLISVFLSLALRLLSRLR